VQDTYSGQSSRQARFVLLALLLLAAVLRLVRLDEQSLWYDEGFSIALGKSSWPQAIAWTAQDVHPPLYYLLLNVWMRLAGSSAYAVRFFSALIGIATVPLMYALGKRSLRQDSALVASLLATLSALYIYYSRETRMYSLLTFLSLLSSYLMLRIVAEGSNAQPQGSLWVAYGLSALGMAYVHYFALLVVATQVLYFVMWWLTNRRPERPALFALTIASLCGLAYSPWLPTLMRRFAADTGYWEGSMPPGLALRRIMISFATGEMLPEPVAWYVTLIFVLLLAVAALGALWTRRKRSGRFAHSFLWLYLLLPVLAITALYAYKPKVTPRYSLLVSPAFLLLVSSGIVGLWRQSPGKTRPRLAAAFRLAAPVATVLVLAASLAADRGLYFSPAMRKPDFRSAIRYICESSAPDEAIVLVSGHMFPIFDYYCPGRTRYPLPDDPVLRVDHMLSLNVADRLQQITAGSRGVWVLMWQDDVVDPGQVVLDLLLAGGKELPVLDSFRAVKVRHIGLPPGAMLGWSTANVLPANTLYQRGITLLEGGINKLQFRPGETAQVTLFWRASVPVPESYTVFAHVGRGDVRAQHDGLPANSTRPTTSWRPGEVIEDRHIISIPDTFPPGEYDLNIGLYNYSVPGLPRLRVLDHMGNEKDTLTILAQVIVLPG